MINIIYFLFLNEYTAAYCGVCCRSLTPKALIAIYGLSIDKFMRGDNETEQ